MLLLGNGHSCNGVQTSGNSTVPDAKNMVQCPPLLSSAWAFTYNWDVQRSWEEDVVASYWPPTVFDDCERHEKTPRELAVSPQPSASMSLFGDLHQSNRCMLEPS